MNPTQATPDLRQGPLAAQRRPRVLVVAAAAGLDSRLEPDLQIERVPSIRLALACLVTHPPRVIVVDQVIRAQHRPESGLWLLGWARRHHPHVARVLISSQWAGDVLDFEASGLAHVVLSEGIDSAATAAVIARLAWRYPLSEYRVRSRPPERPWSPDPTSPDRRARR